MAVHFCPSSPCPICHADAGRRFQQQIVRPFLANTGRYRRFPWVLTADGPVRFP
jgi:hypothetical protein